jgi:hypothetical protein
VNAVVLDGDEVIQITDFYMNSLGKLEALRRAQAIAAVFFWRVAYRWEMSGHLHEFFQQLCFGLPLSKGPSVQMFFPLDQGFLKDDDGEVQKYWRHLRGCERFRKGICSKS